MRSTFGKGALRFCLATDSSQLPTLNAWTRSTRLHLRVKINLLKSSTALENINKIEMLISYVAGE